MTNKFLIDEPRRFRKATSSESYAGIDNCGVPLTGAQFVGTDLTGSTTTFLHASNTALRAIARLLHVQQPRFCPMQPLRYYSLVGRPVVYCYWAQKFGQQSVNIPKESRFQFIGNWDS